MLDPRTATGLLDAATARRSPDIRQWPPGLSQLDGCRYAASDGRSLHYLAWSVTASPATAITPPPAPGNAPSTRFDPALGTGSSGMAVTVGGWSTAQVTAQRDTRRVAVTATARTAAQARRIAVGAARALLEAD